MASGSDNDSLWTYKPDAPHGQAARLKVVRKPAGDACKECPLEKSICVPPEFHEGAKIAIVGEGPGPSELVQGRPFVGPSGRLLNHLNAKLKLKREDFHWTNATLCQGKESQLSAARKACQKRLDAELEAAGIEHVFAFGAHALHATAHTSRKPRILHYRGSVMHDALSGRTIFPMVHPAFVIRAPQWEPVMLTDYMRAERVMQDGFQLPERMRGRTMCVPRTVTALKRELAGMGPVVGVDVETTGLDATETSLVCVGISDGQRTVVVPWSRDKLGTCCYYGVSGQRKVAQLLTRFFAPRTAITHNGPMFDHIVLDKHGVKLVKWEDTLLAHHSFASHMPKRLSHVATMYLDVTPWKDEKHAEKMREYYRYNGRDTLYTKLAWDELQDDLAEEMSVYEQDKVSAELCKGMQVAGFRFDREKARWLKRKLRKVERTVQRKANRLFDHDLNLMSHLQLRKAFFEELGAPVFFKSEKTSMPALNVNALRAYAALGNLAVARRVSDLDKLNKLSDYVLTIRKARKARSTYIDAIVTDSDGRVHPVWQSYGAVSGRFSCVAEGTLVETDRGRVPIESVRQGDSVYCYVRGKLALRQVTWAGCTGTKRVSRVRWRNLGSRVVGHVDLTKDHRVMLANGKWRVAGQLKRGDKVMALSGSRIEGGGPARASTPERVPDTRMILSVTPTLKSVRVYDLSVDEAHNFIANEICVHNCARPNIMNLPRPENDPVAEFGGIRSLYIAAPGKVLVAFDFSQLEMRIAAYVSGDEVMIAACESSDLHAANAGIIFGESFKKLDKKKDEDEYNKLRNLAKQSGFAVAYMAGAPTVYARIIAAGIPITLMQTETMLKNMRRAFKAYYAYQEELLLQTIRLAYVRIPISNRKRWLGHAPKPPECANTPIQGGAAGVMNIVLPRIERQLMPGAALVAQVHDAAYFEVPKRYASEVLALCNYETSQPFEINGRKVVFPTDAKEGERWSDL